MKITGTYTIDAPRERVWAALNDIEVLARIVPGCERLEQTGDNEFRGTVKIGIQTIKGTYQGRIRLQDIQPPRHYRLVANGKSSNGVVDGSGTVDLEEQDGKTLLTYTGDAQVGGTLASVGQRLIEGAAKQMINQSLKALVEQIVARSSDTGGGTTAPSGDAKPADATEPAAAASPASPTADAAPEGAAADAPQDATDRSMPWPFPSSTHPSVAPEAADAPQDVTDRAMPWPFPGSTHPDAAASNATGPVGAPAPGALEAAPPPPSFERRTVVVPDHEQLKPEAMVRGIVEDALNERPWLPWLAVAFLLGYIFGRLGR